MDYKTVSAAPEWIKSSKIYIFIIFAFLILFPENIFAGNDAQGISWIFLTINCLGGLALFLYGMEIMSDSLKTLSNPILGILAGTFITAIIQASGAFMGIIILLAGQGVINLEIAIPLMFGANIGTCITAGLASIGTSREAKRVAIAHAIFKIAGVAIFYFFIPQFIDLIRYLSAQFNFSIERYIANAHTIFNVALAFIFIFFTGAFAWVVNKKMNASASLNMVCALAI